jgi:hypothetical protein
MNNRKKIIQDFFSVAFGTWLLLLLYELLSPGAVQRYINLEYYFYFLLLIFIFRQIVRF